MRTGVWMTGALLAQLALVGCSSPCDELATKICSCEIDASHTQACNDRVASDTATATKAQQDRCAQLVDTCNCNALACGNLAACGLAKDPGIDLGITCQ